MTTLPPAGVAAHHPVTAEIGVRILQAGGNAADAAVAATFAACVGETVLTGLAGGGFAIHWDAATRTATALDFFVDIPRGAPRCEPAVYDIDFGYHTVPYTVGPMSVGVPGNVPGMAALWERWGTAQWHDLLVPAMALARDGVHMTAEHAAVLKMLSPVLTLSDGGRIYAPGGRLLGDGDLLRQPGLEVALHAVDEEGGAAFTTGSLAKATAALMEAQGGAVTADDLAAYTPRWSEPPRLDRGGHELIVRDDLARIREVTRAVDAAHPHDRGARAVALAAALRGRAATGTTNVTVVDEAGNACVVTSSMGLGSGDFLPGLDLQLNSMLGEVDLAVDGLQPGCRLASNMVPLLVVDDDGLVAAGGAAGGSRIPSAMLQVLLAVLDDGVEPQAAIDAPRWHPLDDRVHHEPGVAREILDALAAAGWPPSGWPRPHYYFGGVNLIARRGGGGDPRRSGTFVALR
jgi:gamma-glutamyltranspeptidase / glutathione hydrolase